MNSDGSASGPGPGDEGAAARVARVEESHAFLERELEQLNAEVIAVNRRLAELAGRVSRLEAGGGSADPARAAAEGTPETLAQAERRVVVEAMARAAGTREQAAAALGIDMVTLERLLLRHGLA